MTGDDILRLRLRNHHLTSPEPGNPAQLVAHLGAVQAQDYPAAKWGLGQRMREVGDAALDLAFDRGDILRTHVLRPTWHFVAPADIRWLLKLTGGRVKTIMTTYARRLGLDEDVLLRSERALAQALDRAPERCLTRAEAGEALRLEGIEVPDGGTLGLILSWAELDGLVCSGPRRGRQHTCALLEDRAPSVPDLTEDEMLAELTWRYFNSHGPALVADCAWWSGLPNRMLARGLELNRHRLHSEVMDGVGTYWFADGSAPPVPEDVYLLPNYDEYTVAYRHRDLYYDAERNWTGDARADVPFVNVILLRGQVAGRWKRTAAGIDGIWTIEPSDTERAALAEAKERYARFLAS